MLARSSEGGDRSRRCAAHRSYLKSISCWPGATSWWAASISKPMLLERVARCRAGTPRPCRSARGRSSRRRRACATVGAPAASRWNRKNSTSGPPTVVESPAPCSRSDLPLAGEPRAARRTACRRAAVDVADEPRHAAPGRLEREDRRRCRRSGTSSMSDSSMRVKPSIEEPSNMISPSSAFSNWLVGTSTFLLWPWMSVNWSRRNLASLSRRRCWMSLLVMGTRVSSWHGAPRRWRSRGFGWRRARRRPPRRYHGVPRHAYGRHGPLGRMNRSRVTPCTVRGSWSS